MNAFGLHVDNAAVEIVALAKACPCGVR